MRGHQTRLILWILIYLPAATALSVIVCILMGAIDRVCVWPVLESVCTLVIVLNISGYIYALAQRSVLYFIFYTVVSLAVSLNYLAALLDSAFVSDPRFSNYHMDGFILIAVASVFAIFIQNRRRIAWIAVAMVSALPGTMVGAYLYISTPLYNAIDEIDLSEVYIVQGARRIRSVGNIRLGYVIGEHTVRIFNLSEVAPLVWKFSARKFGRPSNPHHSIALPPRCPS